MAELAAKIRAKFRRRHSAIPGIPSLLSRSSIRSSASHGSSLYRTNSYHSHHGAAHDADRAAVGADGDVDRDTTSQAGSSRVSVIDLPLQNPRSQPPSGETAGAQACQGGGAAVVGQAWEAAALGHDDQPLQPSQHLQVDAPSLSPDPAASHSHSNSNSDSNSHTHTHSHTHSIRILAADVSSARDNDIATAAHINGDHPTAATAALAAPAPAPAPASTAAAAPGTAAPAPLTLPSNSTSATAESAKPSDMSGNDLHPSSRKLSSIHEHPSPDKDLPKQQPHQHSLATADDDDDHDDDHDDLSPTAIPLTDAKPIPSRKREDAKLEPALPSPRLSSRPLHIPLPTVSFGPPSASNLSPTGLYSAASANAPSSPLARYSLTAAPEIVPATAPAPPPAPPPAPASASASRPQPARRQSLLSNRQSILIQTLLRGTQADDSNNLNPDQLLPISGNMVTRKIWVKRPGGSATLVTINEDDLVDDVRDTILRKYANSLGRQFDSPDLTLRIKPGGNQQERMLGPEEPMARTLDAYYPSGQTIEDALIIDVPLRRTPRASPRAGPPHAPHIQYYVEDARPPETGNDYFGPGALSATHVPVTVTAPSNSSGHGHAISVLQTGQVPQIPSPGGRRARDYRERPERPRLGRQHTSSPTLINLASGAAHQNSITATATVPHGTQAIHGHTRTRSRTHSETSDQSQAAPQPPPIPDPPTAETSVVPQRVATPPPRVSSPRPSGTARAKKIKKNTDHPSLPKGMLNGSVPPINVLIVEDNIINLKLLEAFVKRLKVRWSTAMNGRDAVTKWRDGGFHLVLMDIQLPVMSGLDATREIRRLERVNSIGVFSSAASTAPEEVKGEPDEKDKLENMDLFKSPVIIVALTASSLQSDRHEALAAGCNDFLTKPVNFVWLERKVMEWGCMQALIDFDGWRKWKDFAQGGDDKAKAAAQKAKNKKNRASLTQAITATA